MAEKALNKETSVNVKADEKRSTPPKESVYSIKEIAEAAPKLFGVPRHLAITALNEAGARMITIGQAKTIIDKLKNREVKE